MNGIIEVENVTFSYTQHRPVLSNISLRVEQGEFLAIAGPNGAGKSTLLNLLCRNLTADAGVIKIDSAPVQSYGTRALAERIAVVRQEFIPIFAFSVTETVMMARTPHYGTMGFAGETDRQMVNEALELTDTGHFASRPLGSLSSGERQRVFIARALAQNADILLLDEPTSFLDLKHQVGIYDLLKATQVEKGKTIVTITHDINLAAQYCDKILLLGADGTYEYGCAGDIFSPEQIKKVFGVRVFVGKVGREKFFIPLGKFAKDSGQISEKANDDGPAGTLP